MSPEPSYTALIRQRVQLQIRIYLDRGNEAMERELETVEQALAELEAKAASCELPEGDAGRRKA